jgi:hypothetical protein
MTKTLRLSEKTKKKISEAKKGKKNAMYGEIGISKGYRFRLVTNKQYEFCFWSEHDVFAIKTNKEGVEYRFNAYNVEELMNNVINAIYDILPQYKQG